MILEEIKLKIARQVKDWAKGQGLDEPPQVPFAQPPKNLPVDFSVPWPLQAAKALGKKPVEIAQSLAGAVKLEEMETPQASAPGFVNFQFSQATLGRNLAQVLKESNTFGANKSTPKRAILIEFVSANPTGPLHLASGRAATLGDSLARILRRIGHKVAGEYYVNDAGRQVELLGLSVKSRYDSLHGKESAFPEDGYQGEYIKELAAQAPADASNWTPAQFSEFAIEKMLAMHRLDMKDFAVTFERWFRESELHNKGEIQKTLGWLKERGMVYEKDGAVWLGTASQAEEDDKDRVLVKSGGRPTYFLADIAYHKDKFDRGWTELVDILGADHHGYVPRMKAAVAAMGKPASAFHAIVHQLVHLYRGKELVKMSKRAGEFVTLRELMEEVGTDACRFFFARHTPDSHMNFDLELAKKKSQENPVFYVQYVHARICSIFSQAEKAGIKIEDAAKGAALLTHPTERAILTKLMWFPDALLDCEKVLSPHPLPTYLADLAGLYHPFYDMCRVVDAANPELSAARLALCGGVRSVIREGLSLLGVSSPEAM